jgi:hypothetical protein
MILCAGLKVIGIVALAGMFHVKDDNPKSLPVIAWPEL